MSSWLFSCSGLWYSSPGLSTLGANEDGRYPTTTLYSTTALPSSFLLISLLWFPLDSLFVSSLPFFMIWGFFKAASNLSLSLSAILCKDRLGILWQIWDFLGAPNLGSNLLVWARAERIGIDQMSASIYYLLRTIFAPGFLRNPLEARQWASLFIWSRNWFPWTLILFFGKMFWAATRTEIGWWESSFISWELCTEFSLES